MNLATLILLSVLVVIYLSLVVWIISIRKSLTDKYEKRSFLFIIVMLIIGAVVIVAVALNFYGIARIPVLNTIKKRLPETYVPADPVIPPSNGSVQPSSRPAFEEHQREMERIKREGVN